MKLNAEEKKAIGAGWNGLLAFIGAAYKAGVVGDVNESMQVNSLVMTVDAAIKSVLESEDCGCDDKAIPKPQPIEAVQGIPKA